MEAIKRRWYIRTLQTMCMVGSTARFTADQILWEITTGADEDMLFSTG